MYLEPCCRRAAAVYPDVENANLAAENVVELLIGHSASLEPISCLVRNPACAKAR